MAEAAKDMESRIKSALFSRSSYFAQQSDSLTLEGVRRLLEKDLGLETRALDSHRQFVKLWLYKCIGSGGADTSPKHQDGAGDDDISTKEAEPLDKSQAKKGEEDLNSKGENKLDDSPVAGLMTGSKRLKTGADSSEATDSKGVPSESTIKKVVWARASYLRENSENVTLASLRRLLEEDLKLEKLSLDPFKAYIKQQVDEILQTLESPKAAADKRKNLKKGATKPKKEESPTSSENESDEVQEDEVKVRKRGAPKGKLQKSEATKKRKRADEGNKGARSKQNKVSKSRSEGSGEENGGDVSENDSSEGSAEKPVKRKEVPKASYGKQVEHLRSVIKSCGLSVPPSIYKKVKQAPENKREASLIKELEDILAKEGLSSNPSEKEIKDVKKRKEKARELEGIDLSNIVSSSRRRSTSSFVQPPKPQIPDVSESESEESENEDEEVDNEEGDEDQENGDDGSQSEESEADDGDSE